jgi:pyruvate-formate lyase-activating enzyme
MFDPRVTKWARIALSDPGYFTDVLRRKSRKALALDRRFGGGRSFGPSGIVITLTWRCNLRCQMCDQYGDDYKQPLSKLTRDDELELSEWKRVVDETVKYRCEYNLFGGEPLLFNGAVDLIRHIKGKGRRCSITTNGTLLDRYGEDIVTSGLDAMGVSVDGPPDVHDEIRGSDGSFERISQGIRQVKAWREKHGTRTPRININSVVTLWNHDRMLEMVELARELGVDGLTFQHLNFLEPRTMHSHMDYFRKRFQYDWPTREKDLGFLDTSGFDADVIHDQVTKIRKMDGLRHRLQVPGELLHQPLDPRHDQPERRRDTVYGVSGGQRARRRLRHHLERRDLPHLPLRTQEAGPVPRLLPTLLPPPLQEQQGSDRGALSVAVRSESDSISRARR